MTLTPRPVRGCWRLFHESRHPVFREPMSSKQREHARGLRPAFRVYIDEAGDEGFKFLPDNGGSSRWFVLSATAVRTSNDHMLVACAREARTLLRKEANSPLHFRHLKHEQRIPLARMIGELPIRTIHIMVHKPSIGSPENFQRKPYTLYRWATRLLLERVSWLCDGHQQNDDNCLAELIFSNRSAMSYQDIKDYLQKLRGMGERVHITWKVLDDRLVSAVNHDQLAGLQIADAVASGVFYSVHQSVYGEVEPRYLELIRRTVYRNRRTVDGYGIKLWCNDTAEKERVLAICNG